MFEKYISKTIYVNFILWIWKDYFKNPIPTMVYTNKPFVWTIEFYLENSFIYENMFLTDLEC
jgi:hypothetical protein